ncbi:DUF4235 domain-containing protein [Nocardia amikacinitolerans]|uniref:DUF4235 domain-containing protein n=1 Tax=Nocardia amikacinitolerans TaxID=756689 RepID=A0A285LUN9_9NOCA|nr:DUF4235 domain-containing protein [Nocardia amikacinitolerans]MCP2280228.1 Protein of unknown function (DUF4235) [Nocardia amikacinitolerans]MCP2299503.1 Protein of unknown function (DUF4235) [Nocardia amikacinitolerans]MCP2316902.1 Protein of unknown function (DUF4235) [Nocardia amikacinitolerans]SNY88622.1 Protein of unknown function [Nocardia amikacinitolerans]
MTTLYKPLGMIVGVLGGVAANAVFTQVWRRVSGEEQAPSATAREYGWREVLVAAALQGAIFGLVKAAVDRAGATGYQRLTGTWPDK